MRILGPEPPAASRKRGRCPSRSGTARAPGSPGAFHVEHRSALRAPLPMALPSPVRIRLPLAMGDQGEGHPGLVSHGTSSRQTGPFPPPPSAPSTVRDCAFRPHVPRGTSPAGKAPPSSLSSASIWRGRDSTPASQRSNGEPPPPGVPRGTSPRREPPFTPPPRVTGMARRTRLHAVPVFHVEHAPGAFAGGRPLFSVPFPPGRSCSTWNAPAPGEPASSPPPRAEPTRAPRLSAPSVAA
jgi:hypothetical protein